MTSDEIPEDMRSFLLAHVESYEQLDVLALLRTQADRGLSAEEVADGTKVPLAAAETALEGLHESGILAQAHHRGGPRFHYAPREPALDALVDRVLRAYRESPLGIVKLMSTNAIERVRTHAIRAFASSFVSGKEEERWLRASMCSDKNRRRGSK